jgi:hypothetical protein
MVCWRGSSRPQFIVLQGWFGAHTFGNHRELPPLELMAPPEQCGPERQWWGYGHTHGVAAPWLGPLITVLLWLVA